MCGAHLSAIVMIIAVFPLALRGGARLVTTSRGIILPVTQPVVSEATVPILLSRCPSELVTATAWMSSDAMPSSVSFTATS
jgi:hypothetical protein